MGLESWGLDVYAWVMIAFERVSGAWSQPGSSYEVCCVLDRWFVSHVFRWEGM